MTLSSHVHRFSAGSDPRRTPLVLLHGSGGNEHELLGVAADVAPGAPALGIRGAIPFEGGSAFFHRLADRSLDEADILARAPVLADFIVAARAEYRFAGPPIAVGFSNGAIMAAATLMLRPEVLSAAILFRPLSPFASDPPARLAGTPVLIIDGARDTRRAPGDGERLAARLTRMGARVEHRVLPTGHAITMEDRSIARAWLGGLADAR